MSKIEKLYFRLKSRPSDFSYDEAKRLLASYGFIEYTKGKTSGSRVAFIRPTDQKTFYLHKPHPKGTLKMYIIDELIEFLEDLNTEKEDEK